MAEHLFIRFRSAADLVTVATLNDDGHLLGRPEAMPIAAAANRAEGKQVTVLLPAEDFVSTVVNMPSASPSRLRQMLPYSLEDELAGDIEDLHFAAGERNANGELAVAVIAHERLRSWRDTLTAANIHPRRICSEADGVPDTPGSVMLFLEGRKILGRRPASAPFVFADMSLQDLWALLLAEREDRSDLDNVVLFVDPQTASERHQEIDAWREQIAHLNLKELTDGCLPKLAAGFVHGGGANLLQGAYAARSNYQTLARPWYAAAGLAVALVAFSMLGKGAELIKLGRQEASLTAEATAICSASYGSQRLPQCLAEMGRRLAGAGQAASSAGSGGFLRMLTTVAAALSDSMIVNNINYRDGGMAIELIVPNVSMLETFSATLAQGEQFASDVQTTRTGADGRTVVRVRVVELNP